MFFASPWWLLGLVPWAVVSLWLLYGKRKRVPVPFVELWRMPPELETTHRSLQMPLPIAACIAGMGLAVFAAARPGLGLSSMRGPAVTIIVDRGITMSSRYTKLIDEAAGPIQEQLGAGEVHLDTVPGTATGETDRAHWASLAQRHGPTAADTRELLTAAVNQALAQPGLVIVLSDQKVSTRDPRVIQVSPAAPAADVAIAALAARDRPRPQVMVRIRNQSNLDRCMLRLLSDGREVFKQEVELPGMDGVKDLFIDAPLGKTVEAELGAGDDVVADNRAFLTRQGLWPRLEARSPLPQGVQRMIEKYAQLRPAEAGSQHVAVATSIDALGSEPGVVIAAVAKSRPAEGSIKVVEHPITRHVQKWPGAAKPLAEPGWTPIVYASGEDLVAVREQPARQVYVGLDLEDWSLTQDFVVFMSNVFDWVGEGEQTFAAAAPAQLGKGWEPRPGQPLPAGTEAGLWPGVYQGPDGMLRAVNAADVTMPQPPGEDWRAALAQAAGREWKEQQSWPMAPWLLMLALMALGLGALTWKRQRGPGALDLVQAAAHRGDEPPRQALDRSGRADT